MNITFNPILVKIQQKPDLFNRTNLIATEPNETTVLAKFAWNYPNSILMKDEKTGITYEVKVDKDDLPDIDYVIESLLNKINLTHIKRADGK